MEASVPDLKACHYWRHVAEVGHLLQLVYALACMGPPLLVAMLDFFKFPNKTAKTPARHLPPPLSLLLAAGEPPSA